jgi:hypothetical protein
MSDTTNPTGHEWIVTFATHIGVDAPDADTIEQLLDLAGVAAHASERLAAPIACYLVGRAGLSPTDALALARELTGPSD